MAKVKTKKAPVAVEAPDLSPASKLTRIYVPAFVSEEANVSGFAFTKRATKRMADPKIIFDRRVFESDKKFPEFELAMDLASDSAGGPTIGENSITMYIDDVHVNAGSSADYIWLYFGSSKRVKLLGREAGFAKGDTLTWDLNQIDEWLEDNVETDSWDELALVTDFKDGIKIDRLVVKHSGQTILDWDADVWLDNSTHEEYGKLILTAMILEYKLGQVDHHWVSQIHWGAREIGKSDGSKYGSTGAWCSEFASWCLRKGLWGTAEGNIGSQTLEDYFDGLGRMYTQSQLLAGDYTLVAGDYVRFEWSSGGHHSAIFIEYIDDPASPGEDTSFRTIEGNASSTAKVATRTFRDVLSVGNCQ